MAFRKIINYLYKSLKQGRAIRILNQLKTVETANIEAIKGYQREKLIHVLKTCFLEIPYYKKYDTEINLDSLLYNEFLKIPILTKDIIREQGDALLNENYPNINKAFKNTSGGSTGEPVEFYRTEDQSIHGLSNYYYALSLNGVDIYDTSVDLWGAERDMYNTGSNFTFRTYLQNKYTLNTFVLSENIIKDYINRLNLIKPKFIKAYVHSIYDISKYINKYQIKMLFTPIIHCTTGPLYPEMRVEIKKAFNNAHVYNFYGSREVSAIASETSSDNGMSVLFDNVFLEILDDEGRPVGKGEEGNVIVTTLNNLYMPLLRYKIGDRAIKGDEFDFGTLCLGTVVGRTLGVVHKKDGSKIDGQFFTTLFFHKKGIEKFQLVQKTLDYLELNIVKSPEFDQNELNQILSRIENELSDVVIEVKFCEKINLTSTGKIMYVYSEIEC